MILSAFITVVFGSINFFLRLLPSADSQNVASIISGFTNILNYAYAWNFIFPIDTLFTIFLLAIGFEAMIISFRIIFWVFDKLIGTVT